MAFGTSSPELAVTLGAALDGQGDIAVGNAVGSNIFNVLAILGVTGLVQPVEMGGVLAADLWVMVGIAVVSLPRLFTGPRVSRAEGTFLIASYVAWLGWRAGV